MLSSELANFLCTAYLRSATIVTRLTECDDVIKSLFRGAPRLGRALGPVSVRAGPGDEVIKGPPFQSCLGPPQP